MCHIARTHSGVSALLDMEGDLFTSGCWLLVGGCWLLLLLLYFHGLRLRIHNFLSQIYKLLLLCIFWTRVAGFVVVDMLFQGKQTITNLVSGHNMIEDEVFVGNTMIAIIFSWVEAVDSCVFGAQEFTSL